MWLLLLAIGLIIALEVPGMVRRGMWRELAVFGGLMVVGMTLSIAEVLGIEIPTLTELTEVVFNPVFAVMHRLLTV